MWFKDAMNNICDDMAISCIKPLPFMLAFFLHTSNYYEITSKSHHLKVEILY
jgi:hypothetical protein